MQLEEVLIKLGVDNSQVEPALFKTKQAVAQMGKDGARSFTHMGSAAGEFKRLLGDITAQSPALGLALRAVFSPVSAALAGATVAFGYFRTKLAAWNQEMDAAAASNAKAIGSMKDSVREATDAFWKRKQAWDAWFFKSIAGENEYISALKTELALLQERNKALGIAGQLAANKAGHDLAWNTAAELYRKRDQAEADARAAETAARDPARAALIQDIPKRNASLASRGADLTAQRDAIQKELDKAGSEWSFGLWSTKQAHVNELDKKLTQVTESLRQNATAIERNKDALAAAQRTQAEADRKSKESQATYDDLNQAWTEAVKIAKETNAEREKLKQTVNATIAKPSEPPANAAYPDASTLRRTGRWRRLMNTTWWEESPGAALQGQMDQLTASEANARAWGNVGAADWLARQRSIISTAMYNAGMVPKPEEQQVVLLQRLIGMAESQGILIKPMNGE